MSARARAKVAPAASAAVPATGKIKIEIEVDAKERESWINNFALNIDVFNRGYCGYWAFGASLPGKAGWLLFEQAEHGHPVDGDIAAAGRAHRAGKALPKGWHLLDRAAAERAYSYLVARVGTLNTGDSSDYDVAIQLALLGEVRYG